ncbi:MAG: hypothetical protein CG439_215 [Methylococcaceae bacterium NSP1-2]|nr:hypothetical protein [Methylococcaceae bacterium]OYV21055.1 MAG: hypothetical protein CG439_215 [Methylococcaceae bacterium NSP1-2]
MSKQTTVYVLALFVGLSAATFYFFVPFFPYGADSINYIEQARSFMARGVFETIPISSNEFENPAVPDNLFPPGYPLLLIISSKLLFVPIEIIAPWLSLAALVLLPIGIVFSFQRIVGLWAAFWIAILVTLTPTMVFFGSIAYSDSLSLLVVVLAVNRLLVIDNKASSWFYLGLLTGFSYLLRNANIALLISIFLYSFWSLISEPKNRKAKIVHIGFWALGNAVFIVPMFIYNVLIFGKIQPYSMPPSTVGLSQNIHDYIFSQLNTLLVFSDLDRLFNNVFGIIVLISALIVLSYKAITTWQQWQKIDQQTFLISITYTAIGAAITIVARTKYQWGVHIEPRYALPYACFIFVALVIIFKYALVKINTRYLIGLAIILLSFRMYDLGKDYQRRQNNLYDIAVVNTATQMRTHPDNICTDLNGRVALSNLHYVYRIVCAAPVRELGAFDYHKLNESLTKWAVLGAKKGIVVSLFPIGKQKNDLPLTQETVNKLSSSGWQVERNDTENLLLSRKANTSDEL